MSEASVGATETDSFRPPSASDTAGNADRPADKASRLAASEVTNAVLPDLANPVIPMRIVLRSCSTSAAKRVALPTASFSTKSDPTAENSIGDYPLEADPLHGPLREHIPQLYIPFGVHRISGWGRS